MAVDPVTSLWIGLVVAVLGGALSAYMGWNSSNEAFNPRKFINGLIYGGLGGIGILMLNMAALKGITEEFELIAMIITIFVGAIGIDRLRTDGSKAISNRADQEVPKTNKP